MMKRTTFVLLVATVVAVLLSAGCARTLRDDSLRLGFRASENEQWDEAILRWEKAVELAPRSVAAHNDLAVAYEKKGRWEDARKEYEKALALDPSNIYVKHNFERFQENLDFWKDDALIIKGGIPR
jgi:Flp pilus assembly protein TadD